MKTILFAILSIACAAQVPLEKTDEPSVKALTKPGPTFITTADYGRALVYQANRYLSISCGSGAITIDYATGKVTLPEGVTLDEAATRFWAAVANAFPEARQAIIGDGKTVKWQTDGGFYQMGFRSDGVVVWRELKK